MHFMYLPCHLMVLVGCFAVSLCISRFQTLRSVCKGLTATRAVIDQRVDALLQGKLVGRVFEWLLPQPVDDCLRVLSSCLLGGKNVTPLMCSTTETIGSNSADDGEDTVSHCHTLLY